MAEYVDPVEYGDAPPSEEVEAGILHRSDLTRSQLRYLKREVPEFWEVLVVQERLSHLANDGHDVVDPVALTEEILDLIQGSEPFDHETLRVLRRRRKLVEDLLANLAGQGLAYDFEKGTFSWPNKRGQPQVFNRLIVVLFESVPAVPGKGGQPNNRETREVIGRLLAPFFDSSRLDPRRGRTVHQTLRDHLRSQ